MFAPNFPPIYEPHAVDPGADPFREAIAAAERGAEDGVLMWSRRTDRMDCAMVLEPNAPIARAAAVVCVGMIGIGDALGALVPPVVSVTFGWPDRLEVNGGLAGGFRLAGASALSDAVPDWLVLGLTVAMTGDPAAEPGRDVDRTCLHEEGCGEITAAHLMESYSRHFLSWVNRWQEDGFEPVRLAWLTRARGLNGEFGLTLDGRRHAGRFAGLDPDGGMILQDGDPPVLPLAEAVRSPSWSL